ncbi:uncharacterized protein LOC111088975 [Limulus polyphemus]|uniref:Uncharacterized protein LOC111088975 n=1 Tax=Limulus polyphemus TaxID=6850 RepID=A0ABM1TJW7_LIMPO|nr:uncharacterized protein LOC111088975 [Limulus polyphemus]
MADTTITNEININIKDISNTELPYFENFKGKTEPNDGYCNLNAYYFHTISVKKFFTTTKLRLHVIHQYGKTLVGNLKNKALSVFHEMNEKIGESFQKEIKVVDQLAEFLHSEIEQETKIQEELVIVKDQLFINTGHIMFSPPQLSPIPEFQKCVHPAHFTITMACNLSRKFSEVAPSGLVTMVTLVDILCYLIASQSNDRELPLEWYQLTPRQVEMFCENLVARSVCIDWRWFLLSVSSIPTLSLDRLLTLKKQFTELDKEKTMKLSLEIFHDVCEMLLDH